MRERTRVLILADTDEDARRLAEVFSESAEFVVSGRGNVSASHRFYSDSADVVVVKSATSAPLATEFEVPALWLLSATVGGNGTLGKADAILPLGATPAQIRAAAQALAVGLHVSESILESPPDPDSEFAFQEPLTERELEILNLLAEGFSNPEIAKRLTISRNTVKFHVSSIIGKLGAGSRTEAVTIGLRRGLIII